MSGRSASAAPATLDAETLAKIETLYPGGPRPRYSPKIDLVRPADQTRYPAGSAVVYSIRISDPDLKVASVELFANGDRIGETDFFIGDNMNNYQFTWADLPVGTPAYTPKRSTKPTTASLPPLAPFTSRHLLRSSFHGGFGFVIFIATNGAEK